MGALVACFQYELKTILAYSTISNMGYMFIVLGLNGLVEFIIILIFHAYLKIFLFLIIGMIIMYCDGCQDIRYMGGLFLYIPGIFFFYLIASLCLMGLPY
jgi:NADH:ubiquinone oxidoreductase subunit 5 (subunit L)/multisubunit Na+/H+ antiporter MnhA subunit